MTRAELQHELVWHGASLGTALTSEQIEWIMNLVDGYAYGQILKAFEMGRKYAPTPTAE